MFLQLKKGWVGLIAKMALWSPLCTHVGKILRGHPGPVLVHVHVAWPRTPEPEPLLLAIILAMAHEWRGAYLVGLRPPEISREHEHDPSLVISPREMSGATADRNQTNTSISAAAHPLPLDRLPQPSSVLLLQRQW